MPAISNPPPDLSPLEWRAVAIALRDAEQAGAGLPPLLQPLRRFAMWLVGQRPANRLADPGLEAIRLFVSETRRRSKLDPRLSHLLAGRGFNQRQIEALALLAR